MTEQALQPSGMSEMGRLVGVIWEPKPVFEDLAERPRFWVPLILLTVLSVAFLLVFGQRVGFESTIRRQLESNSRLQQMPAEQRAALIEQSAGWASKTAYAGGAVGVAVSTLLVAVILLGSFNLLGGAKLRFRQAFSITCYSFIPSAISTVGTFIVMLLKDPADFDLKNPLPVHLGAFLDPQTTAKWLYSLASSFNVFTIWMMLLMALGFSVAAKKMTFGKALTLVALPWAVVVLIGAAIAGISG
jgi:hypothetical protein